MSLTFSHLCSGGIKPAIDAWIRAYALLEELDYLPSGLIVRMDYENEDGLYDTEVTSIRADGFHEVIDILSNFVGLGVQFVHPERPNTTLRIGNRPDGTLMSYLDVPERTVYVRYNNSRQSELYDCILVAARCCEGLAGVGAVDLDWLDVSVNETLRFITKGPPGYTAPAHIGLVHKSIAERLDLEELSSHTFNVLDYDDYLVLERKDAADHFASLSR